jgi:hypothetical protein
MVARGFTALKFDLDLPLLPHEDLYARTITAAQHEPQGALAQAAGGAAPLQIALAYEAARALGRADADTWRPRLTEAIAAATRTIEEGSAAGTVALARGLLLRGLRRDRDAREALVGVFRLPDRNLSYVLARAALRDAERPTSP